MLKFKENQMTQCFVLPLKSCCETLLNNICKIDTHEGLYSAVIHAKENGNKTLG